MLSYTEGGWNGPEALSGSQWFVNPVVIVWAIDTELVWVESYDRTFKC